MNEVEKMYENCNFEKSMGVGSPLALHPFTAEKQLEIENVILQNKKNYNKWIEYNINVYGEWVIRFVRTDKFAPYIALGKTREEAFANVINHFWQDLTEEERKQIKEILE